MTYEDLWRRNHPGEDFESMYTKICPSTFGYEPLGSSCVNPKDEDVPVVCKVCWQRDMTPGDEKTDPRILDSGERRQFETGAVRDIQEGKGRCDLMPLEVVAELLQTASTDSDPYIRRIKKFMDSGETRWLKICLMEFGTLSAAFKSIPTMLLEVAKHFEEGAKKYGENNWQKGLPVQCYIDSAVRHYLKWLRDDRDEPHDRAFVWNLMCCIWEVDFSPRAKEKNTDAVLIGEHLSNSSFHEVDPRRFYVCNRESCDTCMSDCHITQRRSGAAVLELCDRGVRYEDCPVGLFMSGADGVFLKTEIINAETGLNTADIVVIDVEQAVDAFRIILKFELSFGTVIGALAVGIDNAESLHIFPAR